MSKLQVFNFEGNKLRTVLKDGELWWVLKDVCDVLDLTTPARVAERLDGDEVSQAHLTDKLGRRQKTTIINEPGLYNVILRSDKPEAKTFKRWVTHEVLPSIRATGGYSTTPSDPAKLMAAEAKQRSAKAREAETWLRIAAMCGSVTYRQICASYASVVLAGKEVIPLPVAVERHYTAEQVGRMYSITANRVGSIANQNDLKTDECGKFFHDKSPYSAKEVETFRYNNEGIKRIGEILGTTPKTIF